MTKEFDSAEFASLAERFANETRQMSMSSTIMANSAMRQIIEYGESAIPAILETYKDDMDIGWGMALFEITQLTELPGYNVTRNEGFQMICVDELRDCWIQWGIENEYIQKDDL